MPYKVVLFGAQNAGKSCLYHVLSNGPGTLPTTTTTIACCQQKITRKMKHPITNNSKEYVVHLWDTAGQERYNSITTSYIRQADAIILCVDLQNPNIEQTKRYCELIKQVECPIVFLVGCKSDLSQNSFLNLYTIKHKLSDKMQFTKFMVTSSAVGHQDTVFTMFNSLVREMILLDPDDTIIYHEMISLKLKDDVEKKNGEEEKEIDELGICCIIL